MACSNRSCRADIWGILPRPDEEEEETGKWRFIKTSLNHFTPLAPLRMAGPFGPNIIYRLRPDMMEKFAHIFAGHNSKETEMVDLSGGGKKDSNDGEKSNKKKRKEKKNDTERDQEEGEKADEREREEAEAEAQQHREELRAEAEWEMVEEGMMQEDAVKGLGKEAKISSRVVIDYIYHINARTPATGELAFRYCGAAPPCENVFVSSMIHSQPTLARVTALRQETVDPHQLAGKAACRTVQGDGSIDTAHLPLWNCTPPAHTSPSLLDRPYVVGLLDAWPR
jgi:hypothetical protein